MGSILQVYFVSISAWVKLGWAYHHVHALQLESHAFTESKECGLRFKDNLEEKRIEVALRIDTPPPLQRWSLIVADCVHNARSALDHAVWQLTGQTFDVQDTRTQFPVFDDPRKFRDFGRGYIAKVTDQRARAIIRWVQPYRRKDPVGDILNLLNQLDISDKHKVLGVHAVVPERMELRAETVGDTHITDIAWTLDTQCTFEDDASAAWFTWESIWSPSGAEPKVDVYGHIAMDIVFSEGVPERLKGHVVIPSLYRLLGRTTAILKALIPPDDDAVEMLGQRALSSPEDGGQEAPPQSTPV